MPFGFWHGGRHAFGFFGFALWICELWLVLPAGDFSRAPVINDSVLYHTRERAGMFGDLVLGAVSADRIGDVVVIVDVVAQNTRTVFSKMGGSRPVTIHVDLVPIELAVEHLPEPLDDATATHISTLVHEASSSSSPGSDRALYFVEWTPGGETPTPVLVTNDQFETFVAELRTDPDLPESLTTLLRLYDTHDPTHSVVVWVRSLDADTAWLVDRRPPATTNTRPAADD